MPASHDPIEEVIDALRTALDRALQERDDALRSSVEIEQQRDLCRELTLRFESELEAQRRDLARRLNEEVGRHATSIRTLAETLAHRLEGQDSSVVELASLQVRATDALCDSVREMVRGVRPEALAFGGLLEGLRALVADWRLRAGHVRFELLADPDDDVAFGLAPSRIETVAYEAVASAIDHAVADGNVRLVVVSAHRGEAAISLQVSDDGGDPRTRASAADDAFEALQSRVHALEGTLTLRAGESGGGELLLTLPWPRRDQAIVDA